MRKFVLLMMAFVVWNAADAQEGYKITGTVEGMDKGIVYLLESHGRTIDTLAQTALDGGRFELAGKTDVMKGVMLSVGGMRSIAPMLLDNTEFTALLNVADSTRNKVTGGEQALFEELAAVNKAIDEERGRLYQQMSQAKSAEEASAIRNKVFESMGKSQQAHKKFIQEHPDAGISAWLVSTYLVNYKLAFIKDLYAGLSEKGKSTWMGKIVGEKIALRDRTDIGGTAADFEMTGPDGKKFSMSSVEGKYKILFFWLTTNVTLNAQSSAVNQLYEKYKSQGLTVIGVCGDSDVEAWKKVVRDKKWTWPQGNVSREELTGLYGLDASFMNVYVLDEQNRILLKNAGGTQLASFMNDLFNGKN